MYDEFIFHNGIIEVENENHKTVTTLETTFGGKKNNP